jgi:hypothetical protein
MLANGASQLQRVRVRIGTERLIADIIGRFTRRFLRRKRHGLSLHHHQGVYATVTPAWSQAQRTHVKALPLTGRKATMAFIVLLMAAQGHRCGRYALALREQKRLVLFDLDDILATGLMNLGRRGGIAVMRIQGHFAVTVQVVQT